MIEETRLQRYRPRNLVPDPRNSRRWQIAGMESGLDVGVFLKAILKHRWMIAILVLTAATVSVIATESQDTAYRAEALIEIDTQSPSVARAQDLFTTDAVSDEFLETQYKLIKSNILAETVIKDLDLDHIKEFQPSKWWWFLWNFNHGKRWSTEPSAVPAVHERTVDIYQDRLDVVPVRRSRLVAITFESRDPDLAARVANTAAGDYIRKNQVDRSETSKQASESLSRELAAVSAKLKKAEGELHKYASTNDLLFVEIGGGTNGNGPNENLVYDRLRLIQDELTRAQAARYEKESVYNLVRAGDYASLPGVYQDKLIQDLSFQLANLEEQRAQLRSAFNDTYPKVKQIEDQLKEIEGALARERQHATDRITKDYLAAVDREKLLRSEWEGLQDQANHIAERLTAYNALKREVEVSKNMYEGLLHNLREAAVSSELTPKEIQVVDSAKPPHKAIKPRSVLNLGIGMLVGLLLGVAIAVLKERNDESFKSPEEVERYLNLPLLASVPAVAARSDQKYLLLPLASACNVALPANSGNSSTGRAQHVDPRLSAHMELSEAFRGLCVSVFSSTTGEELFPADGSIPRSVLISSAQPGEGKTMVSIHTAAVLAELGNDVLLVDADLRRPSVHKILDVSSDFGLATYLAGEKEWNSLVQGTRIQGLDILASGFVPENPVELLSSPRTRRFIQEASEKYRYVILDSPALLDVADGRILASFVDGVVLVVKSGATPRIMVQRAESCARIVGATLIGVVLNYFDLRKQNNYQAS